MTVPSAHDPLGIAGFTFADLHQPARLHALYELFCEDVRRADADLWAQWDAYRLSPTAPGAIPRSNLIVAMAPYVSRFLSRLFSVGPEAEAVDDDEDDRSRATHAGVPARAEAVSPARATMPAISSGLREAPPTRAPSISGSAKNSSMLEDVTLPP